MNLTIVKTLSKGEQSLIMDTRPKRLDGLSEDALLDLHARVRRGRNKYAKNYRQAARSQVRADRARGAASKKSRGDSQRAEVFEDALARVSDRLSKAARRSATDLRKKRLAAVKAEKAKKAAKTKSAKARAAKAKASKAKASSSAKGKVAGKGTKRSKAKTPVGKRSVASQRATKARKGAKRGR
ncbi:hypothetical protein [Aquihabitans sp. McL0605]|uniref:hypothetical protein n=1 Tax=Aquihabitans sp. McL0605 TaxID=3415671 RepID=UPI003CF8B36A